MAANKVFLENMSTDDLKQIFDNCSGIREDVYNEVSDIESDFIQNEIYSRFRKYDNAAGREVWSIDTHESSQSFYITTKPEHFSAFLAGCLETAESIASCFDAAAVELIKKLQNRVEFFRDCESGYYDISDKNLYRLDAWITRGIDKLLDLLRDTVNEYADAALDDQYLFSYFSDALYLENSGKYILDNDFTVVYEDVVKTYR